MGAGASALQGLPDQVPKKQAQALAAATPGLHWDDHIWAEIEHSDGTADKVDIIGLLDQLNLRVRMAEENGEELEKSRRWQQHPPRPRPLPGTRRPRRSWSTAPGAPPQAGLRGASPPHPTHRPLSTAQGWLHPLHLLCLLTPKSGGTRTRARPTNHRDPTGRGYRAQDAGPASPGRG